MEVPNVMTPTQFAWICALSSFLLAWMITSIWLALRPEVEQQIRREEIQAPLLSLQTHTTVPVPLKQPMIAQVQLHAPSIASDTSREVALEHSQ